MIKFDMLSYLVWLFLHYSHHPIFKGCSSILMVRCGLYLMMVEIVWRKLDPLYLCRFISLLFVFINVSWTPLLPLNPMQSINFSVLDWRLWLFYEKDVEPFKNIKCSGAPPTPPPEKVNVIHYSGLKKKKKNIL